MLIFVTHKNRDSLQTIGGRVEKNDFHWRHTALREFGEESGWTIDSKEFCGLLSQQDKGQSFVYSERSKHIFWFHEVFSLITAFYFSLFSFECNVFFHAGAG